MREDLAELAPADPGTLDYAENVRFTGAMGAKRRAGSATMTAPVATGSLVAILGGSAANAVVSDGLVYRRATAWSQLSPNGDSRCSSLLPVRRRQSFSALTQYQEEHTEPSIVAVGGYIFCAARQRYDIGSAADTIAVVYFVESEDGRRIAEGTIASKTHVVLLAVGSTVYLVAQSATTDISVYSMSVSSGVLTGPTLVGSVGTLHGSAYHWDAAPWTATHWLLVYQNSSTQATLRKMSAGTSADSVTFTCGAVGAASAFSVYANTTHVYVGHYDDPFSGGSSEIRGLVYDTNLDLTGGPTVLATAANFRGTPPFFGPASVGTKARYVYNARTTSTDVYIGKTGALSSAGSDTAGVVHPNLSAATYPFDDNHCCFFDVPSGSGGASGADSRIVVARESDPETTSAAYSTVELATELAAGIVSAPAGTEAYTRRSRVATLSDGSMVFAAPYVARVSEGGSVAARLHRIDVVQFESADSLDVCDSPAGHVVAGQPTEVLPSEAVLIGFPSRPVLVAVTAGGAGSVDAGAHIWKPCLEDIDSLGRRHRSGPGAPETLTLASALDVDVVSTVCGFRSGALPAIYRSLAGLSECQRVSPDAGADDYAFTSGEATLTDDMSDADAGEREFIYTDGGALRNSLAPCCRFVASSEERIWLGGLLDGNILQASRILVPGEPIQFTDHDSHKVVLSEPCTGGIGYLDGALVAFCENGIYAVTGDGPNDRGQGAFAAPRAIARGLTCIDFRSIVETPIGIFFQATAGIYLLPRGLGNPQFVGDRIRRTLATYPTIVGAIHDHDSADDLTVRFLATNDTASVVLVYSISRDAWSVDTYAGAKLGAIGNWPGGVLLAREDLSQSNPLLFEAGTGTPVLTDAGAFFESRLEFHRIYPAGLMGRVKVTSAAALVEAPDGQPAQLVLEVGVDERETTSPLGVDVGRFLIDRAGPAYRQKVVGEAKEATSVTIRAYDAASGASDYGISYHGFALELQGEPGIRSFNQNERM